METESTSQLLTQSTLFLQQSAKLTQLKEDYKLLSESGEELGVVVPGAESGTQKFLRIVTINDNMLSKSYIVFDNAGTYIVGLVKQKHFTKPKICLYAATGNVLATLEIQIVPSTSNEVGILKGVSGQQIGVLKDEDSFYSRYTLLDTAGNICARFDKQDVSFGKMLLQADCYRIQLDGVLSEDQRKIILGVAVSLDIMMSPTARYPSN